MRNALRPFVVLGLVTAVFMGCKTEVNTRTEGDRIGSSATNPNISDVKGGFTGNPFEENQNCLGSAVSQTLNNASTSVNYKKNFAVKGSVTFSSSITIEAKGGSLETSSSYSNLNGSNGTARDKAKPELDKIFGKRAGELLTGNWKQFYTDNGHASVGCSIFPITKMVQIANNGQQSTVTFEPALPYLLSPSENSDTYQAEIPAEISFTGIKATVVEAGNSGLAVGTEIADGTVTITPVTDPSIYDAEHGYKITINFGDANQTQKLGLLPSTSYYISGGSFVAAVGHTQGISIPDTTINPSDIVYQ